MGVINKIKIILKKGGGQASLAAQGRESRIFTRKEKFVVVPLSFLLISLTIYYCVGRRYLQFFHVLPTTEEGRERERERGWVFYISTQIPPPHLHECILNCTTEVATLYKGKNCLDFQINEAVVPPGQYSALHQIKRNQMTKGRRADNKEINL